VIKYARRPIADFLKEKKQEIGGDIQRLENQKQQAENQIRENQIQLAAGQQRFALIKEKIIGEGQKRKEQLIIDAQKETRLLLETTHRKIETHLRDAHEQLRKELVDLAADLAAKQLPSAVTPVDQERLLQQWFDSVTRRSS
jgi:F-type H+-transporting ATPase subunit b